MHREIDPEIPAAVPLLVYCAGLAAARCLVSPRLAAAGAACAALLVLLSRSPRRFRLTLLLLSFSFGVAFGLSLVGEQAGVHAIAEQSGERFVRIEAPIRTGWEEDGPDRHAIRVDSFSIIGGRGPGAVRRPLIVHLTGDPPPIGSHATIACDCLLRETAGGRLFATAKSPRLVRLGGRQPVWSAARWNRGACERLEALGTSRPALRRPVALVKALVLGRSDQLPEEIKDAYRRGGTYHLLVFSGMQIALVAGFLALLFRSLHAPRAGDWMMLATAVAAPAFAGSEPSVTRASWMIGLYAISRLLHRPTTVENLLFVSALIRLITNPEELTDAGFALTYAATAGLILLGKPWSTLLSRRGLRLSQLAYGAGAELATAPLTLLWFHQIALGASVVTALISPLLAAMFALGCVASIAVFFSPLAAEAAIRAVVPLDLVATRANLMAGDTLHLLRLFHTPGAPAVILTFFAFVLLLSSGRRAVRRAAWIPLLVPPLVAWILGETASRVKIPRLEVLDVGQGDAILIRDAAGSTLLVDGGGRVGDVSFGRTVLLPLLLDRGVKRIDVAVLSHPHPDHCEGLREALRSFAVGELWISGRHVREPCTQQLLAIAGRGGVPVRVLEHSGPAAVGRLLVQPLLPRLRFKRSKINNGSVMLRIRFMETGRTALLPGDAERDAERMYVGDETLLAAEILKVPHHGSRTSATDAFLEAVGPRVAIISCGRHNPFGHPSAETLARLRRAVPVVLRTDLNGSVMVEAGRRIRIFRQIDTFR